MKYDWEQNAPTRAQEVKNYISAQEKINAMRKLAPEVNDNMVKSVSSQRRELLEEQVQSGLFREKGNIPSSIDGKWDFGSNSFVPTENNAPDFTKKTQAGVVSYKSLKIANASGMGPGAVGNSWRGSNDTVRQIPEAYSPLWLNSNLNLPRDRASINAWCRAFYALNPIVHNAISLHSTYPISKLNIKSKNRRVEEFFSAMIEELDLMNVCVQIAQEYWTLGEAFVYAELDQSKGKWKRLLIQNPDYVTVHRAVMSGDPMVSLKPDENLKKIITSNKPNDIQQRKQLSPEIVDFIKKGQNIPLNSFNISHIARKIAPYEMRGTSLIVPCFKALMLMDKLRESKFVQADGLVNPLTLIKVGNAEFRPTPVDLEHWRNVWEEAEFDKNFKIFSHDAIDIQKIGSAQGIYDISGDIQQCIKEIYTGLMVPSVLMDGTDTTYANGSVALDALRQRYMQFRNMLSSWLRNKIFAPISKIQGFYDFVEGQKVLIVPEIDWNHMSLFDMSDHISNLTNLAQGQPGTPGTRQVAMQTLYRSLGLEYEDQVRKMRYEDIQEQIRMKENQALSRYSLSELRALTPDDEIQEAIDPPLPGESPYVDNIEDDMSGMPGMGPPGLGGPKMPGSPPRPPMGAGGGPPKGPGGAPKLPGSPPSGGSKHGPTGGGSAPGSPPPPV